MADDLLSQVYEEHQQLLEIIEEDATQTPIPDIREFLARIQEAGAAVHDPRRRSQLRALMRFWGSFIYDRLGEFPDASLLPPTDTGVPLPSDVELIDARQEIAPAIEYGREVQGVSQVPESGSRFGVYEILERIGSGGFSTVYKAANVEDDRLVAIKIVHSDRFERMKRFREQFVEREKLIGELDHPQIVPVYRVGDEQGVPYIAMKYVESGSLADRLSEWFWRPTIREILNIALQVVNGLEYLHSKDIVHRDIKPANILLDFDNHVYLTDFGIAQVMEAAFQGMIVGTPEYLAPEAILEPNRVDVKADVYAFGTILYELLEGEVPFHTGSPVETMYQQVNNELPPLSRDLPESLRELVVGCLSKAPNDRGELDEIRDQIEQLLRSMPEAVLNFEPAPFVSPPEIRQRAHPTTRIPAGERAPSSPAPFPSSPSPPIPPPPAPAPQPRLPRRSTGVLGYSEGYGLGEINNETQIIEGASHTIFKKVLAILICIPGDQYYVIDRSRVTLGRSEHNDISLDHPTVSRQHALVDYSELEDEEEGTFMIYDLASTNGLLVNGEPCIKQELEHNDTVTFGEFEFTFKRLDR